MNDKERIERLENVLTQFLQPVKNVPFEIVIRSMTGCRVLDFDAADAEDAKLLIALRDCARRVADAVKLSPIRRPRPNEVGNDLEPFVLSAAMQAGLHCTKPLSKDGRGQGVGYPDLLVTDAGKRPAYLEVKSYADGSALTTMRSFYLSPSENPKVSVDARHLLGFVDKA